jgi:DNA (cytosine-5)-methyltransferase 1
VRVLSLFSGIGGMDLGLERAGMKVVYHSEIEPYACSVLKKHWPDVPNLGDIKLIKWKELENVDLIAGGYPCQPFSSAGKRRGKEDPRHLWPYVLEAIRELRPRYALMENVRGHLSLGFREVLADLAACGYSAEWQLIPASSLGAPHRRDRIFFVAYPDRERPHRTEIDATEAGKPSFSNAARRGEEMADSEIFGSDERGHLDDSGKAREWGSVQGEARGSGRSMGDSEGIFGDGSRPRQSEELASLSGAEIHLSETRGRLSTPYSTIWQTEPDVGRVAHGVPSRVDRLRGLGNAVVPQVAEFVGRKIMEFEARQVQ